MKSCEDSGVDDAAVVAVTGLVVGLQALAFFDPGLDDAPQLLGARISINVISTLLKRAKRSVLITRRVVCWRTTAFNAAG